MKLLEPELGDVVSGDLWRLVNKPCETATSSYYAAVMLLVRKAHEIIQQPYKNGRLAAVHNWRPLADGNILFAVRYFL